MLHLICGKIAAGKSTLTARLAKTPGTIVVSEDEWLGKLFSNQMDTVTDYVRCSAKLRQAMGPHIAALLNEGLSVVLDFPANTVETRAWMRSILDQTRADHTLHVLDVPDEVCLARLRTRNAQGDHPFAATEEQFHRITRHHVEPTAEEGFTILRHISTD